MIDYHCKSPLGNYPLKIEVSNKNKSFLQSNILKYETINNVNVYSINELIKMKTVAFSSRDKIRDFYDLGYLLKKYPNIFSEELLFSIHEKISYTGTEQLNLLLKEEVLKYKLVSTEDIYITANYCEKIENQIENLLKKINIEDKVQENFISSQTKRRDS